MEHPALTPSRGFGACPAHVEVVERIAIVERDLHAVKNRLAEYDVAGLREVVADLRGDLKELRTKLWFYQMGATAAGGLIVILLDKVIRGGG